MKNIYNLNAIVFASLILLVACDKAEIPDTVRINKQEFAEKIAKANCPEPTITECLGIYGVKRDGVVQDKLALANKFVCNEAQIISKLNSCLGELSTLRAGSGTALEPNIK